MQARRPAVRACTTVPIGMSRTRPRTPAVRQVHISLRSWIPAGGSMVESQPGPTAYDDLLDRLLAGATIDVEDAIRLHPELTSEETRALRTLAFARGPGKADL